jgi:hypothetical protein
MADAKNCGLVLRVNVIKVGQQLGTPLPGVELMLRGF